MTSDNQAKINSCNQEISNLSSQISSLEAQIERLDAAAKVVETAYNENVSFLSSIKNYEPNLWEGSNRDTFGEDKISAEKLGDTYQSNIYDAYWLIRRKRDELKREKFSANFSLTTQKLSLNYLSIS